MGGHHQQALSSPEAAEAFDRFVRTKRQLLAEMREAPDSQATS